MTQMTLASIEDHYTTEPPRIVIYGPHGIGKTTFGAAAPGSVILPIEKGLAGIRAKKFPLAKTFGDVISAINTLLTTEHPYQTLVVDSLDWLEPLVWDHTAFMGGKENIEDFGYGKGFKLADEHWRTILGGLTALQEKGIVVICIAHSQIKRFDAPDTDAYDRYQIKLHDRAAALVNEWADVIGFAHLETVTVTKGEGTTKTTKGQSSGQRVLSVEERPAYQAKNRYGMPPEIPFPKVGAWEVFANAVAGAYTAPPDSPAPAIAEETTSTDAGDRVSSDGEHDALRDEAGQEAVHAGAE